MKLPKKCAIKGCDVVANSRLEVRVKFGIYTDVKRKTVCAQGYCKEHTSVYGKYRHNLLKTVKPQKKISTTI